MGEQPRVGISRCLLGDEVRHDGGHKREPLLVEALGSHAELVPVCPEVEVGMGVPREPIQLVRRPQGVRLRGVTSATDWTERMHVWATRRIQELEALGLSGFVLKARSPSCGIHGERGMFADALIRALPDLPVEDEERLRDPDVRARFLARVRAYRTRPTERRQGVPGDPKERR